MVEMLQDGDVNLAVLLQPGVAGELEISQERERTKSDGRG
jgi:hypothetical protein